TSRAFCAVRRTKRLVARVSTQQQPSLAVISILRSRSLVSFARAHQYSSLALISILRSRSCSSRSLARRRRGAGGGARRGARGARGGRGDTLHPALAVARVTVEGARGRELAELVANRVLRDEDGDE